MKSPGLAAVLSFFVPGLGQIYNGEIAKGLVLVVADAVSIFLLGWILVGYLISFALRVYAIYDAYRTAERINAERGRVSTF